MQIIEKTLEEIKPYEHNPRNNFEAIKYVKESIKEFGFKVPIVIDKDGVIVAGHTRYEASKELKLKSVPCIVADDLTEAQIKAFRIADNKVAEKATWEMDLLRDELLELDELEIDMSDFGFADFELMALLGDFEPEGYDNDLMNKYTVDESELLKENRVIITYKPEEEEFMKTLLKCDRLQVKNNATTLIEKYERN